MIAPVLALLIAVSDSTTVGLGTALVRYLRPVLATSGQGVRVDYEGVCPGGRELLGPSVDVRVPPPATTTGVLAAQEIFRDDQNVMIAPDNSGVLRITVGHVLRDPLQTRLPSLTFDTGDQYTPLAAVLAVAIRADQAAKARGLRFGLAAQVSDVIVGGPVSGAPHLPPTFENSTVDQLLDTIAKTFHGIVLYGSCRQPGGKELFQIGYISATRATAHASPTPPAH